MAAALFAAAMVPPASAQVGGRTAPLRPAAGMVITRSTTFRPGTYRLSVPAESALIVVRGDSVTLDFTGVVLEGQDPSSDPDQARGIAVRIDGGRNVRVIGGRIRGYKTGILARGTRELEIRNADLSYNWKPRLFSLIEHESLVDWLSFHNNEANEWLRFGAAIYLDNVSGGLIQGNVVTQGMNALLMNRVDHVTVRDNNFSYNSGLGIGLYRSSDNTIVRNSVDFNIRGYSHGFYRRGQDSAGILLYEQSNSNIVALNSATHGGDGLFLWAGNYTMNTGQGGSNDNVFYANDFSFAPANGMEATFSRNTFIANIAEGNDYGLWGGYSFDSRIVANCFANNRYGIAIEHGQQNSIIANRFISDSTAIRLWGDSIQPSEWGYPKYRDTRSRDYLVHGNEYVNVPRKFQLSNTARVDIRDSSASSAAPPPTSPCSGIPSVPANQAHLIPALTGIPHQIPKQPTPRRHRSAIIVDEWGPYDYRSPRLWPADSTRAVPLRLVVHGPPGAWTLVSRSGVQDISASSGRTGDTVRVTPNPDSAGLWEVVMEYRGTTTTSARGAVSAAGSPVRFGYSRYEPPISWQVNAWAWPDSLDPRRDGNWERLARGTRLFERIWPRLDIMWYRPTIRELPQARFALEASGAVTLPEGEYTLRTISDDGIRVWVDGRLVIDNWDLHGSEIDYAPLTGGRHELRVQYFQIEGWAELRLDILRGRHRSTGSPGPH
ncbi:MAG TPA: right-handed parallel beta-helix repeat-containing protein [Gemmatimonadaceae bacterium]